MSKTNAFHELLKVIFCKAHDEKYSSHVRFYVTDEERRNDPESCQNRINGLFEEVKSEHQTIFRPDEQINFSADVLAFVVSELEPYLLLSTASDVKGEAYETIVGSNLRGDRGEFFTPRNVCQAGVAMAFHTVPRSKWSSVDVIDPACGTGGFLISVIDLMKRSFVENQEAKWDNKETAYREGMDQLQTYCENHLSGIDLNPELVRAAQMNEVMHGNGHQNPFPGNSLDYPETWSDGSAELGKYDLLFTNPPFGAELRIERENILRQYDLARQWDGVVKKPKLQKSVPPQQLFIERSVQFLKQGGVAAIVAPDGILTNPGTRHIRHWLLQNTRILACIGLPRETFEPYTPTKTHLVVIQKRKQKVADPSSLTEKSFMTAAKVIGSDKRGEFIPLRTPEGEKILNASAEEIVNDDLPAIVKAFRGWYDDTV